MKTYLSEKYNLYVFFSEYGRLSVTEKPLLYNLRQKCHVNFKNERRMLTKLIIYFHYTVFFLGIPDSNNGNNNNNLFLLLYNVKHIFVLCITWCQWHLCTWEMVESWNPRGLSQPVDSPINVTTSSLVNIAWNTSTFLWQCYPKPGSNKSLSLVVKTALLKVQ